jgi:hypothetical protein
VIAALNQTKAEVAKWSTAVGSRSTLTGVRGFESLPPHHGVGIIFLGNLSPAASLVRLSFLSVKLVARGALLQVAVSLERGIPIILRSSIAFAPMMYFKSRALKTQ